MSLPAPIEQIRDTQQLQAEAYVHLYEIQLYPTGSMFLNPHYEINWQGNTYNFWGMKLTGLATSSDDKTSRPQLSLANFTYGIDGQPIKGVFSALSAQDKIEGATVIRRSILKPHADENINKFTELRWKVAKIVTNTPDVVTLELRNTLDGPRFTMPARKYLPPDFPQVTL